MNINNATAADDTARTVAANVRALLAQYADTPVTLATVTQMDPMELGNRLEDGDFTVAALHRIAQHYSIPTSRLVVAA